MSIKIKAHEFTLLLGDNKGEKRYSPQVVTPGKKTTDDAAKQISEESSFTVADVIGVLNRYKRYVQDRLSDGFSVELLGFGVIYPKLVKTGSVKTADEVTARLVKCLIPGFRPAYTIYNGNRIYTLMPEKISIETTDDESATGLNDDGSTDSSSSTTTDSDNTGGSSSSTDSGTSDSGNSGVGGDDSDLG